MSRGVAGAAMRSAPVSWAIMPPLPVFGSPGRKPPFPVAGGVGAIAVGVFVAETVGAIGKVTLGDGRGVIVGGTVVGTAVGAATVGDGLGLALGDGEALGTAVTVGEGEGEALGEGDGDAVAMGEGEGETLGDGDGEALGDGLAAAPVSAKVVPASTVGVASLVSTSAM